MKLVLLPGMDGTGKLFNDFLSHFDGEYEVIRLPQYGPQSYQFIASIINPSLPTEDYIILAESFSGGIVPELLKFQPENLKGIILVASFLSCPNQYLISIAKILPIKFLASIKLFKFIHKFLFLGEKSSDQLVNQFVKAIKSVPERIIKNRLDVISHQQLPTISFDIPVVYIQATKDRLIPSRISNEFVAVFPNIEFIKIDGPHFILQSYPKEASDIVRKSMFLCINKLNN